MIKVSVNGAKGRLGRLACCALLQDPRFELVGQLGREDDLARHCQQAKPEVVLNLVPADAVMKTTEQMIRLGVRVVVGASGLKGLELVHLASLCETQKLGALVVPNFSISAILMMHFSELAARYFRHCEIVETHHEKKQDAPSGTSLRTAELIASRYVDRGVANRQEALAGARGAEHHGVAIHSLRLPGVGARQEVFFSNDYEMLTLRQDVFSREAYVSGALLACEKVMGLSTLQVGLESIVLDNA